MKRSERSYSPLDQWVDWILMISLWSDHWRLSISFRLLCLLGLSATLLNRKSYRRTTSNLIRCHRFFFQCPSTGLQWLYQYLAFRSIVKFDKVSLSRCFWPSGSALPANTSLSVIIYLRQNSSFFSLSSCRTRANRMDSGPTRNTSACSGSLQVFCWSLRSVNGNIWILWRKVMTTAGQLF